MLEEQLGTTVEAAILVAVSALAIYLAVLVYTRLAGLRSLRRCRRSTSR